MNSLRVPGRSIIVSLPISAIMLVIGISCSPPYAPDFRGHMEPVLRNDTLIVDYDFVIKQDGIDSVAFQLSQGDGRSSWNPASDRVVDSILDAVGDSIECCQDYCLWCLIGSILHYQQLDSIDLPTLPDTIRPPPCWWLSMPQAFRDMKSDSVSKENLYNLSIPCSWFVNRRQSEAGVLDSNLQADSILYRNDSPGHKSRYPHLKGSLIYTSGNMIPSDRCWLKIYGKETEARDRYLWGMPPVWDDFFPPAPEVERFEFYERGHMVGMLGGIGLSSTRNITAPTPNSDRETYLGGNFQIGFSYYATKRIYNLDFEFHGFERGEENYVNNLAEAALPMICQYFGRRTMHGISVFAAPELSNYSTTDRSQLSKNEEWGGRFGIGYESRFDRFSYSFHTAQDGYHHVELLVGFMAIQQGKAGLKLSMRRGDRVRTSALQVYMQNRIDPTTMAYQNPRSLGTQILIYAGMIGAWMLLS